MDARERSVVLEEPCCVQRDRSRGREQHLTSLVSVGEQVSVYLWYQIFIAGKDPKRRTSRQNARRRAAYEINVGVEAESVENGRHDVDVARQRRDARARCDGWLQCEQASETVSRACAGSGASFSFRWPMSGLVARSDIASSSRSARRSAAVGFRF